MEGSINLCLQSSKYLVLNIFDPQAVKIEEENVQAGREEGFAPENMNSIWSEIVKRAVNFVEAVAEEPEETEEVAVEMVRCKWCCKKAVLTSCNLENLVLFHCYNPTQSTSSFLSFFLVYSYSYSYS